MRTNSRTTAKTFLMGQDVELYLLYNGRPAPFEGDIKSEFGLDGVTGKDKICEIRTVPSLCPLEIVNSIHQVFQRKIKLHPRVLNYDWHAGSFKIHSLGGHIHFGCLAKDAPSKTANQIVANYAGALSLALEDPKEAVQRRNNGDNQYGFLNDLREKPYGFESRCFSSWAVSPAVAAAHLCLAKTVMHEILNNKSFNPVERFTDEDFVNANISKVRKNFDAIWSEITSMQLYRQYKQYIDIFKFLIENKLTWFPKNMDVKVAWGLADYSFKPEIKFPLRKKAAPIVDAIPAPLPQHKENFKNFWAKVPVEGIFA